MSEKAEILDQEIEVTPEMIEAAMLSISGYCEDDGSLGVTLFRLGVEAAVKAALQRQQTDRFS